ncbi:MAG TPA: hypothetical protein VF625_10895 [Longimicrobium sp.]|jgi:hypothetical protein
MTRTLAGQNASHNRMLAILCAGMLGACAPRAALMRNPQPAAALDTVASRLGVAVSPDYHEARGALLRVTGEWNDSVPPHLEGEARALMRHVETLEAMKRQPVPAGEWEALIARAKALARAMRQ